MSVKQRKLGKTGYDVSEIGLGCWQLGGDWGPITETQSREILAASDSAGVTFWDTADVYGGGVSEKVVGQYNKDHTDINRLIVTKAGRNGDLYPNSYTKGNLKLSIERSRERLQVDSVPLVQLHCIPFEELQRGKVFEWLDEFQQQGLIKHYGASVENVTEALFCLENTKVSTLQIIFNVLRQDMAEDVLPFALQNQVGIIVRLGLASGLLSGKMTKDQQFSAQDHRNYNKDGGSFNVGETFSGLPFNKGVDLVDALKTYLPAGMTMPEMALRWLLDHEAVSSIITGASRPDQIRRNAAVCDLPPLDPELHQQLTDFYLTEVRDHIRGDI